jgi:glyoxylase-like metal-dependent hydrolase (beta-lactamase superfamily II)
MKPVIMWTVMLSAVAAGGFADEGNIFSYRVGAFEVYMLVENQGEGRPSVLIGAGKDALDRYVPGGTYPSAVNTFLVRTADRIMVVDTGFGGAIFEHLKTLGVSPDQVDVVLITHMHGDHIGGLARDGRALFPKARVYLARQERDYWTRTRINAAAVEALAPYGSRVETFLPGELGLPGPSGGGLQDLLPGITPIAAFGHTPGHTLFMVESNGERLLIWGDLMHVQGIQFPLPDISVTYDTDPAAAAAARKRVLAYAAANRIPIAGMHLTYPAIGTVTVQGEGYRFVPAGR